LLFAEGESVKQAPPADSSWSLCEEDVDALSPGSSAKNGGSPCTSSRAGDRDEDDCGAEPLDEGDAHDMLFDNPLMGDSSLSLSDLEDAGPSKQPLSSMMGDTSSGTVNEDGDASSDDDLAGFTSLRQAAPAASSLPTPGPVVLASEGESAAKPRARREVRRRPLAV